MKLILYMGISANGYIAKQNGDSEFTSDEDLKGFYELSKKVGNVIMGKNTHLYIIEKEFFPFPDALNIVVSHESIKNTWGDKVLITNKSPKDIIQLLEDRGFKTAFLAGGGQLNSSFMKEGLIDEIYLDIEPLLFGKGIKIFNDDNFEYDLELLEINKMNKDTVQLHYRVIKSH